MSEQRAIEAELIFGALKRERQWKVLAGGMTGVAMVAILAAAITVVTVAPPPPVLVPYDPETGLALPNASVRAITLSEEQAVIEASVYRYVTDRETYNGIDNDVRITRALEMSEGPAHAGLARLWNSAAPHYPPARYGDDTVVDVQITSISFIGNDRVQVRLIKRLVSPDGQTQGSFTAVLGYAFQPGEEKTLEAVWRNPLGFTVTDYSISADRGESR